MKVAITEDLIRQYLPNTFAVVEGETPLSEKIQCYADRVASLLSQKIVGDADLSGLDAITIHIERTVIQWAIADALPSLDLVITPAGAGIVSTQEVAPASKERVARLIDFFYRAACSNISALMDMLPHCEQWRSSEVGKKFCGTFMRTPLSIPEGIKPLELIDSFEAEIARRRSFQKKAAIYFLGNEVVRIIADASIGIADNEDYRLLVPLMQRAYFRWAESGRPLTRQYLWHALEDVIATARDLGLGELLVQEEPEFENDVKGAFYF